MPRIRRTASRRRPAPSIDYRPPTGFGIRVDSAAEPGYTILPRYDSLIAKLIVWGRDRDEALGRLRRALRDFVVTGVPTTVPFHLGVITSPEFEAGDYDTRFLEKHPYLLKVPADKVGTQVGASAVDGDSQEQFVVEVSGKRFEVVVHGAAVSTVAAPERKTKAPRLSGSRRSGTSSNGRGRIISPIQGTVLRVAVTSGDGVSAGDLICVVEAMKMENEITAPHDGVVNSINVAEGDTVQTGAVLAVVDPAEG